MLFQYVFSTLDVSPSPVPLFTKGTPSETGQAASHSQVSDLMCMPLIGFHLLALSCSVRSCLVRVGGLPWEPSSPTYKRSCRNVHLLLLYAGFPHGGGRQNIRAPPILLHNTRRHPNTISEQGKTCTHRMGCLVKTNFSIISGSFHIQMPPEGPGVSHAPAALPVHVDEDPTKITAWRVPLDLSLHCRRRP
jgi:hypothetical protein